MYKVIKAAAVSLRAKPWDKSHNADKMEKFIRLAARKRPDLGVLPEWEVPPIHLPRRKPWESPVWVPGSEARRW